MKSKEIFILTLYNQSVYFKGYWFQHHTGLGRLLEKIIINISHMKEYVRQISALVQTIVQQYKLSIKKNMWEKL